MLDPRTVAAQSIGLLAAKLTLWSLLCARVNIYRLREVAVGQM